MCKAIFLDRDGVINELVYHSKRDEYEPPFRKEDLKIIDGVIESLKKFLESSYKLFLVSNQPDYAKGKTKLEDLKSVHEELHKIFSQNKIKFEKYYYCYHHPDGVIPDYSFKCECRKPGTYFIQSAVDEFKIETKGSWMIGDRDKDIICGKNSGLKTIWIKNYREKLKEDIQPDFEAKNLAEASEIILGHREDTPKKL